MPGISSYIVFFFAMSAVCAAGAFSLAGSKGRSAFGWALSCFSMPPLLLVLLLLPSRSGRNEVNPLVYAGLLCAALSTLATAASFTGADRMILRGDAFPGCGDDDAKTMVVTRWASEHTMNGSPPIVGMSAEKTVSDTARIRVCEADTVSMDGTQHHIRFTMTRAPGKDAEVTAVTMTR